MNGDGYNKIFTYHLIRLPLFSALRNILFPLKSSKVSGLVHAETMSMMQLGSSIFSPSRFFAKTIVVFAQWECEEAFHSFLHSNSLGLKLSKSWYLKLKFVRQWGSISKFEIPEFEIDIPEVNQPVIAVTLARMRYVEIPRFLRWGRPVEKFVRDHSGTTLSLASIRYPNLISTFSIWKSKKEMSEMVYGHSNMAEPKRHINAMKERDRKNFHYEFTTLRFLPISEHGVWNGKCDYSLKVII